MYYMIHTNISKKMRILFNYQLNLFKDNSGKVWLIRTSINTYTHTHTHTQNDTTRTYIHTHTYSIEIEFLKFSQHSVEIFYYIYAT